MTERFRMVEEIINNIFETNRKTRSLEFHSGNINNEFNKEIHKMFNKQFSKYRASVRDRKDMMMYFSLSLYEGLHKVKDLKSYEEYSKNIRSRNSVKSYLYGYIPHKISESIEDGTKRMRMERGGEKVLERMDVIPLEKVEEWCDLTEEPESGVGSKFGLNIIENRDKYFLKNQQRIYNILKEDFNDDTVRLNQVGFSGVTEYLESKGLTYSSYNSFKRNVRKRVEKKYVEEDTKCELGVKIDLIIGVLEDEELEDNEVEYLINKLIVKYYEDEKFEGLIIEGLNTVELKELVRMIRYFEGKVFDFKGGELQGVEDIEYISKGVMYKIINNLYDWKENKGE